jgi:hypothetical protein
MSGFVEYPKLSPQALAAVNAAFLANGFKDRAPSFSERCYLAAFLREAMAQARASGSYTWCLLEDIADSLHDPPPPPPTLAEAREAARQLAGPCAAVVHAYLATLQEAEP